MMLDLIRSDIKKYYRMSGLTNKGLSLKIKSAIETYGLHSILIYRYGHWVEKLRGSRAFYRVFYYPLITIYFMFNFILERAYDIKINRHAEIGKCFYIGHFGGIRIPKCKIGENCSINQRVKIEPSIHNSNCHIGNSVWIGAHSIIKSGVKLGNRTTVAAGSVVLKNVSDNYLVSGNPARPININYDNSALFGIKPKES